MNEDSKNQIDPFSPKASLGIPYHENEYFQKQIYPKFLKFLDFNTDQAHTLMYDGISAKRYRHSTLGFSEEVQKRFWKPKREYRNIPGCVALPALGLYCFPKIIAFFEIQACTFCIE